MRSVVVVAEVGVHCSTVIHQGSQLVAHDMVFADDNEDGYSDGNEEDETEHRPQPWRVLGHPVARLHLQVLLVEMPIIPNDAIEYVFDSDWAIWQARVQGDSDHDGVTHVLRGCIDLTARPRLYRVVYNDSYVIKARINAIEMRECFAHVMRAREIDQVVLLP